MSPRSIQKGTGYVYYPLPKHSQLSSSSSSSMVTPLSTSSSGDAVDSRGENKQADIASS